MSDFFEEEFNKQNQINNDRTTHYPPPPPPQKVNRVTSIILVVVMVALILGSFALGIVYGTQNKNSPTAILDTIIEELKQNSIYYDADNWAAIVDTMVLNAGTSMLQTIDKYGYLLSPNQFYEILYPSETTGGSATYGISFLNTTVGYYVRQISYGSGAFKSNLMVGDIVLLIDREGFSTVDVRTASEEDITAILGGDWGTSVTFTALRGIDTAVLGDDISIVTATATKIRYEGEFVEYYFGQNNTNMDSAAVSKMALSGLNDTNVGYIRLNSFEEMGEYVNGEYQVTQSAADQMDEAMDKFKTKYSSTGKLVLDLTGNPGGSVEIAKDIASYFIYDFNNTGREHLTVTTLEMQNGSKNTYTTQSKFADYFDENAARFNKQIVVLTDKNSASASELLLGAMLDYGTCLQVGDTTFGKGIAQTAMPLMDYTGVFPLQNKNGSVTNVEFYYGLYYTIAMYYLPISEMNLHGVGLTPLDGNKISATDRAALVDRAKALLS